MVFVFLFLTYFTAGIKGLWQQYLLSSYYVLVTVLSYFCRLGHY